MKKPAILCILLTVLLLRAAPAFSGDDENNAYPRIKLSGLADIRMVASQKTANWSTCPDGTGMQCTDPMGATRYGGNANTGKTFFDLSQLTLDVDAAVTPKISLHTQLDVDVQSDGPSRFGGSTLSLIESYLTFKHTLSDNAELRLGIFAPRLSRENTGPHWTTQFTITPSAINTWLATLIRVYGAEAALPVKDSGFTLTASLFSGADEGNPNGPGAGKDLVNRGWLMHDYWMPVSAVVSTLDNKIGFYGKLKYEDSEGRFDMDAGYYDNNADVKSTEEQDIWATKFFSAGARADIGENFRLMGQYLQGQTQDYKETAPDVYDVHQCEYKSYYLMGIYAFRGQGMHLAARYDYYKVNRVIPSYFLRNEGHAWTFAAGKQLDENQSVLLEYLTMKDKLRRGITEDVPDNLLQLSYKISF